MGALTDELRKFVKTSCQNVVGNGRCSGMKKILAIADRIDAEHESACAEAYGNGVMSVPIALDESQWVKLPVDADGVPIRIGDVVTCGATVWTVTRMKLLGEGWGICCTVYNEYGGSGTNVYPPSDLRHYHAPTVEDVLREFAECVRDQNADFTALLVNKYAAKLRLAGDAE